MTKVFGELGRVAIGSRLRLFAEAITRDAERIYALYGVDLNPKWFATFYVLSRGEPRTITSIARDIGHSHVSVSKIIAEMKRAKLVVDKDSPADRRRTLVTLSRQGKVIAARIEPQYDDVRAVLDEVSAQATHDLWEALAEWERLFAQDSLYDRVTARKTARESGGAVIVPYLPKYRAAFRRLNEEWIETYFKLEQPDRDTLGDPEGYVLKAGGHIFVALVKDQPVGVCALLKRDDRTHPWELAKMAVSPAARGRNIGWLLGQAVVTKAKALGAKRLYLESNTVLKPAIGLYRKLGFETVTGAKTPYQRCNIQMVLKLR